MDRILILLDFGENLKTEKGIELDRNSLLIENLPRMLQSEEEVLNVVTDSVEYSTVIASTTNLIVNSALGLSLNMLWGCLNNLQLNTKLPLLKMKFPASANMFNEPMITIASFDILD